MSPISRIASLLSLTLAFAVFAPGRAPAGSAGNDPIADAGPDQTVDCESAAGASVTLDGTGSSDPDGDPLTFTWTNSFGVAFGPTPTVSIAVGADTVTLLVDDGTGRSDTDDTLVTVTDLTAPAITGAVTPARQPGGGFIATFGCTDLCDASPSATATLGGTPVSNGELLMPQELAGEQVEVTCTDSAGNAATRALRRGRGARGGPSSFCGLGFELALLLPLVAGARRRARAGRIPRKVGSLVAGLALVAGLSGPVGAATLSLTGSTLGVSIGGLPPITIGQSPDPFPIAVSSGTGGFVEPAGLFFEPLIQLPKQLFTGVPLISGLTITNGANGTKTLFAGGGLPMTTGKPIRGGGGFGGPGPLSGNVLVNVLGLFNLTVPLAVAGATSGFVTAGAGGIQITVTGTNWTTGFVLVSQVTASTPSGFFVTNTVAFSGFDFRSPGHAGTLLVISPFHVTTNVAGNLPGVATQTLVFAPAPREILLLLAGGAAMAGYGWRRLRRWS